MKNNYFRLAIASLRQEPVVSAVSIAGTALAIFLIMVMVMMEDVKVAPFAPEEGRSRWLINRYMSVTNKSWREGTSSNGPVGERSVSAVFRKMEVPEAVTAFICQNERAMLKTPGGPSIVAEVKGTDGPYWDVMNFTFLSGSPYTTPDYDSKQHKAVINKNIARRLFDTDSPVGRQFSINRVPYTVCGVVEPVSPLGQDSYAQVWVPSSTTNYYSGWCDEIMGTYSVIILAKDPSDFPAIRQEYADLHAKYADELAVDGWTVIHRDRPYTQLVDAHSMSANLEPDINAYYKRMAVTFAILLLVPAINLSSMTSSRLSRRREEIGVRRSFGATRTNIAMGLLVENFIVTLIAGVIAFIITTIFMRLAAPVLLAPNFADTLEEVHLDFSLIFSWTTFGVAFALCFLLNLISSGAPALHAARQNIVNALAKKHE